MKKGNYKKKSNASLLLMNVAKKIGKVEHSDKINLRNLDWIKKAGDLVGRNTKKSTAEKESTVTVYENGNIYEVTTFPKKV